MNLNFQTEEEKKFFYSLTEFLINTNRIKPSQKEKFQELSGKFHPLKLYKLVCRKGGFQAVTNRNKWAEISLELYVKDLPALKDFYYQYLHPYERKYYFGKDGDENLPNLICSHPRKIVKTDQMNSNSQQNQNQQSFQSQTQNSSHSTYFQKNVLEQTHCLSEQINKKIEEEERERKIFFLNKNKLNQTKAETKKIILGLESYMEKKDIIYSLNTLLLYSINIHFPFLFQNNQKIFSVLSSFAQSIYPPKREEQLEYLRTVVMIFRNFAMSPINLKYILDKECSKNVIDIMTGLVKVGWDCRRILINLETAVSEQETQTIQSSIELLRGLVDERQESLSSIVSQNIKVFNRALMSQCLPIEIKEQVLEIIAFVTDSSPEAREIIAKDFTLMGIIIGVLQRMTNHEKLTRLAALTLNNISNAMSGKPMIKEFEAELITIGFTDDSLAGIVANILADVATL